MSKIRVGIVNDYPIIVEGIASIFRAPPEEFEVLVGLGTDAAPDGSGGHDVDIVLIDPFGSSTALSDRIPEPSAEQSTKYVVITWQTSASSVAEAFDAGCAGFLTKTLPPGELRRAVKAIHRGRRLALPADGAHQRATPTDRWPGQELGLTARESEVLILVASGLTNAEIVEQAHIGRDSLKGYIRSAYRKIGVTRRSQAIIWCLHHGLGGRSDELTL